MPIYVSSGAIPTRFPHELVRLALEYGITHLELTSSMDWCEDFLQPIMTQRDSIQFLIHNYFPPSRNPFVLNLASTDVTTRRLSIDMCRTAINLSADFGAPFYSVHSGFGLNLRPDDLGKPDHQAQLISAAVPYETAYAIFRDVVGELTRYAELKGISLLLENNVITRENLDKEGNAVLLMGRAEEYERLFSDINSSALGALVDTGHLQVTAKSCGFDPASFISRLAPHIRAFHISENDGLRDTNQAIREDSWFLPIIKQSLHIPVVIEAYNLNRSQIQEQINLLIRG